MFKLNSRCLLIVSLLRFNLILLEILYLFQLQIFYSKCGCLFRNGRYHICFAWQLVNLKQVIPIGVNWHLYLAWKRPFWSQSAKTDFAVSSLQFYLHFLINFTSLTNGNDISVSALLVNTDQLVGNSLMTSQYHLGSFEFLIKCLLLHHTFEIRKW